MRITYTAASPKSGITEHIDNVTGRVQLRAVSRLNTSTKISANDSLLSFRQRRAQETSARQWSASSGALVRSDGSAYSQNVVVVQKIWCRDHLLLSTT